MSPITRKYSRGTLLLDIDPRDYTARLMQARAVLQAALTKQQAAQSSVELVNVTSNAGIQQAAASVALAKSAVQTAHAQVSRRAVGSSKRERKSTPPWPTPPRRGPRWQRLKPKSPALMPT